MSEGPFETVRLSEIERVPITDTLRWTPVRRRLGIRAFGINAYTADNAGDEVVEDHNELGGGAGHHEEVYFVVSGHAVFTVAGEEIDAPAGTFVFVRDPAVQRHAVARSAETTVLAVGASRGEPFEPSPWEYYFGAIPLARAGDYAGAAAAVREGLTEHPDHPSVLYNLACFEARAGERDAALEHVRRAVELDPQTGEWAKTDEDLDSIRDDPRFPAL